MSSLFGGRRPRAGRGNSGVVIQIAREVIDRRRSVQGALYEVRHPAVLDALGDDDFTTLDALIAEHSQANREFAIVLARLTHAAARAKGFDRQIVDAALRLDTLLPAEDPSREREQLLRDAYVIAQRSGYVYGGRVALGRLGRRAADNGDTERARLLLGQQLELGPETGDTASEVDSALVLGDVLRREGDAAGAQTLYRRAGRAAQRLDYSRGVSEALLRQIESMNPETSLETLAALQRQALDAAQRTADLGLQSRIVLRLAETLARNGKPYEAVAQLHEGLTVAREIGDLALEGNCLVALVDVERRLGRLQAAAEHEQALVLLEERLGNRLAAAEWAARLGTTCLSLGKADDAALAFERARTLATAVADVRLEQRALGGLGIAFTALGRPVEALDRLMAALELARRTGDQTHEAQWLGSIGQALWTFEQADDAINAITEAVMIARRVDDMELQASMFALLGEIYAADKETSRAREFYGRAHDLYRRLGQTSEQVRVLSALANLALEARQAGEATSLYERALRLATEGGDRLAATRLHGRLGRLAQKRRDLAAALDHFRRAADLAETIGRPPLLNRALQHLATAQDSVGDPGAAATYRRALTLCLELSDVQGETLMRLNLGSLLSGNGHREEGIMHLRQAMALAAGLGPEGDELARRAEAAIVAAGGAISPDDWFPGDEPRPARRRDQYASGDGVDENGDAFYRETTLPPS